MVRSLIMKSFSILVLFFTSVCSAISTAGTRTLVIVDDDLKSTYGGFISDIQSRGFQVSILSAKATNLNLFLHDERSYDHVILFPSKLKGLGPSLTSANFLKHASTGGNILIFLESDPDGNTPVAIAELASQLDITLAPKGSVVIDHFSDSSDHTSINVPLPIFSDNVKNYFTSGGAGGKVSFKGQAMTLGNSALVQPILKAPRTAFAYDTKEAGEYADDEGVFAAGGQLALVACAQSRNNARITFVGGADMVSDSIFKIKDVVNRAFAKDVSAWTFQETGVLRVDSVEHWGAEKGPAVINGSVYRIKSEVSYQISISEYSYDQWKPFQPAGLDEVQLEFRMLDPYYRLSLQKSMGGGAKSTVFSRKFTTPDQHGIFTFSVNYKRPFLTYIHEKDAVTIRHMAHNEWTRSWGISGSWVWIAGIWVVVAGWIGFVALWLWNVPVEQKKIGGKKL